MSTEGRPGADVEDRSRFGRVLGAGVWLVFLITPLQTLWADRWEPWSVVGLLAFVAFVALYLWGLFQVRWVHLGRHYVVSWVRVLTLLGLAGLMVPAAQDQALVCCVYVTALAVSSLPRWHGLALGAVLVVVVAVAGRAVPGWSTHGSDFAIVLAGAAVWSFRLAWTRQASLRQAEQELSDLAIEEERSRIARDLHDILGHSLTVISVKSELAARLVQVDPERAQAELEDVQRLARDALADVRATTRGLKGLSLPAEIAEARSALESAGIRPDLPTVTEDVPTQWRELYAWTLREAVTNAIRHSGASRVDVTMGPAGIRVTDDGAGADDVESRGGSGLDGLRHRAGELGAAITTGPGPEGRGFVVEVVVPA